MMYGMATDHIGTRIKRARERLRWTQRQLADALGVNVKSVDNWENGRTNPRSALGALEEVLGISFGEPEPESAAPSRTVNEALDRAQRELEELRQMLRDGRGKEQQDDEPNGDSRRAS